MILKVNPADDLVIAMNIAALNNKIFSELSVYKDKPPTQSELKNTEIRLEKIFRTNLLTIGHHSYITGCKEISVQPSNVHLAELHSAVKDRAHYAAHSIVSTTALAFGELYAALGKKTATGKKRSKGIADYEGNRIFFEQRTKAWRLKAGLQKSWYPTSDNVCPICEDNEDEGKMPIDQPFPSGDIAPPAHFGCLCYLGIIL